MLREDTPKIERVLERRTTLSRRRPGRDSSEQVLAANVDVLFIVCGLDRDYNSGWLERYLVLAHDCGARPVIVLNRADLADELGFDLEEVVSRTHVLAEDERVLTLSASWLRG